jgi:DNA primase
LARIRQEDVEAVRDRTDIVSLVQQYVGLKKTGARWSGLCPFHTEKTASFSVDPAKGLFYCFGCGKGGNAFHFVQEIEQLSFPEAVERLASRAGVTLRYENVSPGERQAMGRRQSLFRANGRAAELFHRMLLSGREGEDARAYLAARGISKEAAEEFGIGYAPRYSDFLLRRMTRDFSSEILVEAGLAHKDARGEVRDSFRGRVIFPVHDLSGRVVGFGARLLDGEGPKYLNTRETEVYRKGQLLYNLHRAKTEVSRTATAYVVEGYTDVIALHGAGVPAAVATCGTALGEGHFELLRRFAERVVLAFDSDEAGAGAAQKAYSFHERYPLEALVLVLPEGLDPADFVEDRGPEAFAEEAGRAVPLVEFMIRRTLRGRDLVTPEGRARAVQAALPIIDGLEDPVRRGQYAGLLADLAGVSSADVQLELGRPGRRPAPARTGAPDRTERGPREARSAAREVEKEALKILAQHPEASESLVQELREDQFETQRYRKAFDLLRKAPDPAAVVGQVSDPALAQLVAELTVEPLKGETTPRYARHVLWRLVEYSLKRQIEAIKRELQRLNPVTETDAHERLFKELVALEAERREARVRADQEA